METTTDTKELQKDRFSALWTLSAVVTVGGLSMGFILLLLAFLFIGSPEMDSGTLFQAGLYMLLVAGFAQLVEVLLAIEENTRR